MARFEKSRPKSAKPHAAVAPARRRGSTAPSIEDTMFFPRLRRHAKWMFVLLALVFGLGFVVFGVGAGGTGIGDIFRGSGGSSGQSVSDARRRRRHRPKDPQAWRDLATALETEGQTAEAIVALNTAIDLNAKDGNAYRELAGLHLTRATERQQDAQLVQIRAAFLAPAQGFPSLIAPSGQSVLSPTRSARRSTRRRASASTPRSRTRRRRRPSPWTPTSGSSRSSRRTRTSSSSSPGRPAGRRRGDRDRRLREFLKLAPDDPSAGVVRQQLKQLRGTAAAASG